MALVTPSFANVLHTYESYSIPSNDDIGEQRRAARRSVGCGSSCCREGTDKKGKEKLAWDFGRAS
jgi:hypothetical protein